MQLKFFGKTNIDFVGFRFKAFIFSGTVILAGLVATILRGGMPLGVDFTGGTLIHVRFDQKVEIGDVRSSVARTGYDAGEIQEYGSDNEFIVRIEEIAQAASASDTLLSVLNAIEPGRNWRVASATELPPDISKNFEGANLVVVEADSVPAVPLLATRVRERGVGVIEATQETSTRAAFRLPLMGAESKAAESIKSQLVADFPGKQIDILRTESVGPKIGQEIANRAWAAIIVSLFGILIYVTWRFEFKFAIGAIASLVHDVLFVLAVLALLDKEISLLVVASLLTIIGYSLNDTIVVYDRIRENFGLRRKESYEAMINISVNETLSRTIITGLTTILIVAWLFFFGGEVIHDFALAMLVGLLIGTYSSIYIAAAAVIEWQNRVTMRGRKTAQAAA